jgi:acetyl-CoA carboxylase biotin carboxylase subunit
MICRINAEDPNCNFLPSPGRLREARLPGGAEVRVESYIYGGCYVSEGYDPLIALLATWGESRQACLARLQRALEECKLSGIHTNVGLLKTAAVEKDFVEGCYTSSANRRTPEGKAGSNGEDRRDLAIIAGLLYEQRSQSVLPASGERYDLRRKRMQAKAAPDLGFMRLKDR